MYLIQDAFSTCKILKKIATVDSFKGGRIAGIHVCNEKIENKHIKKGSFLLLFSSYDGTKILSKPKSREQVEACALVLR